MIELLRRSTLFAALPDAALALVASECTSVFVPGQSTVFRQGDPSDGMYLVDRGRLRILDETGGGERVLGHVGRGGHVGELSLLTGEARAATARSVRDTSLLRIDPAAFHRVMEAHPRAALQLARSVTKMLLARREAAATAVSTIAIVPAERDGNVAAFARDLARAFEALGTTALVDEAHMEREVTSALDPVKAMADSSHTLSETFERIESGHEVTLYVTDADDTPWTRRCVRHADLVLEVTQSSAFPRDAPAVSLATEAERQLAIVYAAGTTPPRAITRIAAHPYDAHHIVEAGRASDFARLARLLGGRAHGLALSGGGGRTVAYVGVLRALAEAGVPIDVVGGTSGGAMLGAMCALGWDHAQMVEAMRRINRTPLWLDLCPPLLSIMSGRLYERMLHGLFGDATLEDLAVPLLPVCARLDDGSVVVPSRGAIWRAVRASSSLPGIWPPVLHEGHLLVDGGISNNLPIDLVRARCGRGPIIACDVGVDAPFDGVQGDVLATSGWDLLLRRLWPFGPRRRGPGLLDVVVRATCAAGTRHRALAIADAALYIEPLGEEGPTSVDALVARGYDAARAALDRGASPLSGARAETIT